jgi:hypothetical protein
MLARITQAFAVIALLAMFVALAGPGDGSPAMSRHGGNPTEMANMASGGGNLVPLW